MIREKILARLLAEHPGWPEWDALVGLVETLSFNAPRSEYLGQFWAAGERLVFALPRPTIAWPEWMPKYVRPLYGMKVGYFEQAGGYAAAFSGSPASHGSLFSQAGNDSQMGFPVIPVPPGLFWFQTNFGGALFHLNQRLEILYPDLENETLAVLDTLEEFTKVNLRQVVKGERWYGAYADRDLDLLD